MSTLCQNTKFKVGLAILKFKGGRLEAMRGWPRSQLIVCHSISASPCANHLIAPSFRSEPWFSLSRLFFLLARSMCCFFFWSSDASWQCARTLGLAARARHVFDVPWLMCTRCVFTSSSPSSGASLSVLLLFAAPLLVCLRRPFFCTALVAVGDFPSVSFLCALGGFILHCSALSFFFFSAVYTSFFALSVYVLRSGCCPVSSVCYLSGVLLFLLFCVALAASPPIYAFYCILSL